MLTLALYGLLAIVVIGGLFLVAARLLPAGEQIAPPVRDEPIWTLPAGRTLVAADVAEVRLPVALRGYRFAETDQLLDRLVEELQARDDEIARLRGVPTAKRPAEPTKPAGEATAGAASTSPTDADPAAETADGRASEPVEAPASGGTDLAASDEPGEHAG